MSGRTWRRAAALTGLVAVALAGPLSGPAAAGPEAWQVGDLFIAVGDGSYQVFDSGGQAKQRLSNDVGGYTTDCAFNPAMDRLFATNFTHTRVEIYDGDGQAGLLEAIEAGSASPAGHSTSITFDADGRFYVGHPDGNGLVHQYSADGALLSTFAVDAERRGSHWLDLGADQRTLFYTSQGRLVQRYDLLAGTQLPAFAELPGEGHAQSLRLLPPGDGSAGLLVADGADVKRVDAAGRLVQTYDAPGQDGFFALNLDPDGRSFWAADSRTDGMLRFDLESGRLLEQFFAGSGHSVYGVCLKGEPTAAVPRPGTALPANFRVEQNWPNPFNPTTHIRFALPAAGEVRLTVFNMLGQQIRTLVRGEREAGVHTVTWDGRDDDGRAVSSGVYLYRLDGARTEQTRRMLLLR